MADCSKTLDFILERERMCKFYENCEGCPATDLVAEDTCLCAAYEDDFIKDAIIVVQKWSDEHPEPKPKTYADDFFEKFPKAAKSGKSGYPSGACKRKIYDGTMCDDYSHCEICWNEPYKEEEE